MRSLEEKHYVCDGSCGGVASAPGVCESEDCSKHGQPLRACDCQDGNHYRSSENNDDEIE